MRQTSPSGGQRGAGRPGGRRVIELARFALVSALGTGVDFLVLWLLVAHAGWAPVPAKLVAVEATIVTTFLWNNAWTFGGRGGGSWSRRVVAFHLAATGSFALGLVTIALLVTLIGPQFYLLYNVATLPLNLAWTYLWSARVIWRAPDAGPRSLIPLRGHSKTGITKDERTMGWDEIA